MVGRTSGGFALTVTVLIAASLFFSYLATTDPYQTCTRSLKMANLNEPYGTATLTVGMTYSVHAPDSAMWIKPITSADDQVYIVTADGGLPIKPGSCDDKQNTSCNKEASDGYLWGLAGVAVGIAFLLVLQYLVDSDPATYVIYVLHVFVLVYFIVNTVNMSIIEHSFMGHTSTGVQDDFTAFIGTGNFSDGNSIFGYDATTTWSYYDNHATCKPDAARWWCVISFVCTLFAAVYYFVSMGGAMAGNERMRVAVEGNRAGGGGASKADRNGYRLIGFGCILACVVVATLSGMAGTSEAYGKYVQKNILHTSAIKDDTAKCYFDNHWDITKHGVRAYMTGTAKNNTHVKPTLKELAYRLTPNDFEYNMDLWDVFDNTKLPISGAPSQGEAHYSFFAAMASYLVLDYGQNSLIEGSDAILTFPAAINNKNGKTVNCTGSVAGVTACVAHPYRDGNGTAGADQFTHRVTITCNGGSATGACITIAADVAAYMSKADNSAGTFAEPLTQYLQANISMAQDGRDYFLKAFLANTAPGARGTSPMECSLWNHNIDADTKFKWKHCDAIKDDMNGDDCMKSACETRKHDFWFTVFAFIVIPGTTALLWAFNWSFTFNGAGGDQDMYGLVAGTVVALAAYLPVLCLVGFTAWRYPMAGDNECQAANLGYFKGPLAANNYEEHSAARASVQWIEERDRTFALQFSFFFYLFATIGVMAMVWTSNGSGALIGSAMSDAEKQTGKFTRLTTGF